MTDESAKVSFFFLPSITWFSGAFQRPQQLARALAHAGGIVLYCEPWGVQDSLTEADRSAREFVGLRDTDEGVTLLRCPPECVAGVLSAVQPAVLVMYWPQIQSTYLPRDVHSLVVYEVVDDPVLLNPRGDPEATLSHELWMRRAGVITASATILHEMAMPSRPDAMLLPNGVSPSDWARPRDPIPPDDMKKARERSIVVYYHGAIASWFDWDLLLAVARFRPEWSFVLVGGLYVVSADEIDRRRAGVPNVYLLGMKPYRELGAYIAHADVACIPFILNDITHACSPVKLFEYMAAGKPIVATPMREILQYRSVLTAATAEAFVAQIEVAIQLRFDAAYLATLDDEARANTWDARARALFSAVEHGLVGRAHCGAR